MFGRLFLLFTLIPILELYMLVSVGSVIGGLPTIGIVIITGIAGAWLARMEGFNTMQKVRQSLNEGAMPADEMVEGLLILIAGLLLLTPGFVTDFAGLALLLPLTRKPFARWLRKQFSEAAVRGGSQNHAGFTYYTWHSSGGQQKDEQTVYSKIKNDAQHQAPRQAIVIDCEPVDDEQK
ncbi:FxsA family protein [Halodesulfovibrio aestuarii]|nr:FxsA family protein [Halodesulfovibrio aestuarii]